MFYSHTFQKLKIRTQEFWYAKSSKGLPKIYLYHIRKTAGTSLIYSFLSLAGCPENLYGELQKQTYILKKNKAFIGWNPSIIERGNFFFAFSHLANHEINLPSNTFTITCFRDPVDRVISHYKMLIFAKNNPNYAHRFRLYPEIEWLGTGFNDFLKNIPKEHLMRQLYMFSPNFDVDEAIENSLECSYVMFSDRFNCDIQEISSRLNLPLSAYTANKAPATPIQESDALSQLREYLEPEYRLYDSLKSTLV